ncbi:hypothetical protein [Actinobaculum sp. 352]|uniref:hypothetical protein n=1 Tax=Actinobaculum sp. 352 TaxID=2490946 RepID=UPI000F7E8CC3|nr:hypothetical protein [Actinobaculum sp. 352]RTE48801.1 hypothetical protein EKN07_08835 [Actinobaculum sp. 352]
MQSFFVTFGMKYSNTPHPASKRIDHLSLVMIMANTLEEARATAVHHLAGYWSRILTRAEAVAYHASDPRTGVVALACGESIVYDADAPHIMSMLNTAFSTEAHTTERVA